MSAEINSPEESSANTFNHGTSAQTLLSLTIQENSGGQGVAEVCFRRVSDGAVKVIPVEFGFKRNTGGATSFGVNILAAKGTVADLLALALCAANVDEAGDDIRVRITPNCGSGETVDVSVRLRATSVAHI